MASILIVDDEETVRNLVCSVLSQAGHRAIPAADADQAFALFQSECPHLVIVDFAMPHRDGFSLIRQIRTTPCGLATPIILYTGMQVEQGMRDLAKASGVLRVLAKPHLPAKLISEVNEALSESQKPLDLPADFDRDHLRVLANQLALKVQALQEEVCQRKKLEAELRQAATFNRQIIDSAHEGIVVYDRELRYTVWNPFMERWTGKAAAEVLGRHPWDVFPFLKDFDMEAKLRKALAGENVTLPDIRHPASQDDQPRWAVAILSPLRDSGGAIIGGMNVIRDISGRKRAEAELRDASEFNRQIVASAQEGIVVLGPDFRYILWNTYMEFLSGYSAAQVLGKHPWEVFSFLPEAASRTALQRSMEGETVKLPDAWSEPPAPGRAAWVSQKIAPLRNAAGEVVGVICTIHDITQRTQAEAALRVSEERLRLALDAAQMGTFDWDIPRNHVSWTGWHEPLWGYAPGEFRGTHEEITQRVHPEDLPGIRAEIERCLAARQPFRREFRVVWPDGTVHWVLSHGEFAFGPEGQPLRMRGVVNDITDRKRVEEARLLSETQLAGIIGSAMDGVITIDENQRIVLFNAAAEQLFGFSTEQVIGQPLETLIPERHRPAHREHIQAFSRTGVTTRRMGGFVPVVGRRSNGQEFPVEVSISQIAISGRKFYAAIVREITERLRSETQLKEYADRLRVLSQKLLQAQETERRQLARELHDEIGQVLCAVSVNLKLVKTKVDSSLWPRLLESICIVDTAIDQVRNLSLDLRPSVLDDFGLESALRWYVDRLGARTGLRIHLTAKPIGAEIPSDVRNACFRVAQEALTNVVRHASARQAWVGLERRDSEILVAIRDDGKGFDVKAARLRAAKGESLGLLGMHERVELLGGKTLLHSEPGKGTTIQIQLPLVAATEQFLP